MLQIKNKVWNRVGNLLYTSKHYGWQKGVELFQNETSISVIGDYATEVCDRLMSYLSSDKDSSAEEELNRDREELDRHRSLLHQEVRRFHENPHSVMSGPFFFESPDGSEKFVVEIIAGEVRSFKSQRGVAYVLKQISVEEFYSTRVK